MSIVLTRVEILCAPYVAIFIVINAYIWSDGCIQMFDPPKKGNNFILYSVRARNKENSNPTHITFYQSFLSRSHIYWIYYTALFDVFIRTITIIFNIRTRSILISIYFSEFLFSSWISSTSLLPSVSAVSSGKNVLGFVFVCPPDALPMPNDGSSVAVSWSVVSVALLISSTKNPTWFLLLQGRDPGALYWRTNTSSSEIYQEPFPVLLL